MPFLKIISLDFVSFDADSYRQYFRDTKNEWELINNYNRIRKMRWPNRHASSVREDIFLFDFVRWLRHCTRDVFRLPRALRGPRSEIPVQGGPEEENGSKTQKTLLSSQLKN